jgi:hypothetical protein
MGAVAVISWLSQNDLWVLLPEDKNSSAAVEIDGELGKRLLLERATALEAKKPKCY